MQNRVSTNCGRLCVSTFYLGNFLTSRENDPVALGIDIFIHSVHEEITYDLPFCAILLQNAYTQRYAMRLRLITLPRQNVSKNADT